MIAPLFIALLSITAGVARPLVGRDNHTWTPKNVPPPPTPILLLHPDSCDICKLLVTTFDSNMCQRFPKNVEDVCEKLIHEIPASVICKDVCTKNETNRA